MDPKSKKRRAFLKRSTMAFFSSLIGMDIVFAENAEGDFIPKFILDEPGLLEKYNKDPRLRILNDRPLNVETPAHLLNDKVTPAEFLFVRNNGIPPTDTDIAKWTLTVEGESAKERKTYSLQDLKNKFRSYTYQLTLECGGNGRNEFNPPAKGNQWTIGAVGCPAWTGVRLKDVLDDVGIKNDAVYVAYYGRDKHLSGDPNKKPISRGVPVKKALEDQSLIAWAMNGKDLPLMNGYPLRLVFGGWPGSTSGKWLDQILVRNQVHDGPKMGGYSYRVPCNPVAPGTVVSEEDMCIIESMPVKSLITGPKSGAMIDFGDSLKVNGHAWAGDLDIKAMHVSIDFGATWMKCNLNPPVNKFAWQHWSAELQFPKRGYYEVWARATDAQGNMQPMVIPGWNPKGYLNNACHRIAVKVT